uniref:thymidine phosphorylase isoform X2 n=1 Tax=Myxine glutinosa TaxID=7769 RepID=UPI00358EA021
MSDFAVDSEENRWTAVMSRVRAVGHFDSRDLHVEQGFFASLQPLRVAQGFLCLTSAIFTAFRRIWCVCVCASRILKVNLRFADCEPRNIHTRGCDFPVAWRAPLHRFGSRTVTANPAEFWSRLDIDLTIAGANQLWLEAGNRDIGNLLLFAHLEHTSILSKKLSERLSALVLDVKYGKAAFCKTLKIAQELTEMLVRTGADLGLKIVAVLSQMDHPIGLRIGNALEVMETVECLHGKGPEDLNELVVTLGGLLLHNVGKAGSAKEGSEIIQKSLKDGSALSRFQAMLVAQGVELDVAHRLCQDKDFSGTLGQAPAHTDIRADAGGLVQDIDAMALAQLLLEMGAGRTATGGVIDHKVGVQILVPVGQPVNKGQPWIRVFHNHSKLTDEQMSAAHASVTIASSKVQTSKRITHIIRPEDLNLIEAEKHLTASTQ